MLQNYWDGYPGPYYGKSFPTISEAAMSSWSIDYHFPGDLYVSAGDGYFRYLSFGAMQNLPVYSANPDPAYVSKFGDVSTSPPDGQSVGSGWWMQNSAGVMTWYGKDGMVQIAYVGPPPVVPPSSSSCVVQDMTSFGSCVSDMSGSVVLAVLSIASVMIVVAVARSGVGNVLSMVGFKKS